MKLSYYPETDPLYIDLSDAELVAELEDGRRIAVPLSWYPRIEHASEEERQGWELIGGGTGDISVEALMRGKPSSESQSSFARWLAGRHR